MNRRNALKALSMATGGVLTASALSWTACQEAPTVFRFFKPEDTRTLDQIGETILPKSPDSPGAGEIGISEFMDIYAADCLKSSHQAALRNAYPQFLIDCQTKYQDDFVDLSPEQQHEILLALDAEAILYNQSLKPKEAPHFFSMLKNMVLIGFFTSEQGAKQSLRYLAVPGRYDGNYPFQAGDKSWAL